MHANSAARISLCFLAATIVSGAASSQANAQSRDAFAAARERMVREYLEADGIKDKRVLDAFRTVPRHEFCLGAYRKYAYMDGALPIGYKQTISPPFVVAYMTQTIDPQPTDKVLEIGTGSGFQAAILSPLVKEVYTIEIVPQLGRVAEKRLKRLGFKNVSTKIGDGFQGWKEHAPFDKIIVTCSPENVPKPLIEQLNDGGKLLIPLGERYQQVFHLFEKKDGELVQKQLIPTLFVPMTGVSEDKRKVQPDPANPRVVNGSFEVDENNDGRPDGWHYQRQAALREGGAPDGKSYLSFASLEMGRRCQIMQGTACDGRRVKQVTITVTVRYEKTKAGGKQYEAPGLLLHFYDAIRKPIGYVAFPAFVGDQKEWKTLTGTFKVPANAREAIMQIGLNGGTGKLDVDDVSLAPAK